MFSSNYLPTIGLFLLCGQRTYFVFFIFLTFIKTCFMPWDMVYFAICCMCTWKNVYFSVIFWSIYKCYLIQLADDAVLFSSSIYIFDDSCLLVLLITETGMLKSSNIIVNFPISLFSFTSFASCISTCF